MKNLSDRTVRITFSAVLAAVSIVLVSFIHFPIFPAVPFLEYDPADVSILMGSFLLGPLAGIIMTVVVSLVQGFTVSAASGIYGIIMHIIATSVYAFTAGMIYKRHKSMKGAAIALICGTAAMALVMIPANLVITPLFTGWPVGDVAALLGFIILFNIVKAGINGAVTFIIYKPLKKVFRIK